MSAVGRRVLSWPLSITTEAAFCVETLEDALARYGKPEVFNTDQGSQFTGAAFTGVLTDNGITISMDGKGAWRDNVFVERHIYIGNIQQRYLETIAMSILLAFAPFMAFAILDRLVGSAEGLFAGFVVSAAILTRDWLSTARKPKLLEIGTTILFGLLAAYALVLNPAWSVIGVRLMVDAGLLVIVLTSILVRHHSRYNMRGSTLPRRRRDPRTSCGRTT
jgi:hypothetical protein